MNKEELIKKYKDEFSSIGMNLSTTIKFKELWIDILELDEPQKVNVPQFVANWYEKHKYNFEFNMWDYVYRFDTQEDTSFKEWLNDSKTESFKTLVNMHQFGYEVEKEKRYRVSLKNGQPLLKAYSGKALYFSQDIAIERCKVTRKELDQAGFAWVLDCPGIEIEEVEE